jgi:phage terminase large subunit-like protein
LLDATTKPGVSPNTWALAVLRAYYILEADVIYAEVNNGGDMVENTIRQVKLEDDDGNILVDGLQVPIVQVRASRGKQLRAQPVAAVFEQGRGHHVGHFPALERQLTQWEPGQDSPDRLDSEVWLYTGLGLAASGGPVPTQPEQANKWRIGGGAASNGSRFKGRF